MKKVVWIFTANRKMMMATPCRPWITVDWSTEVELLGGFAICLEKVVEGKVVE